MNDASSVAPKGIPGSRRLFPAFWGLLAILLGGCADMDFLPSWVPFQSPASDKLPGVVTPAERVAKYRALAANAGGKGQTDRQAVSHELAETIRTEKDPLIRLEIIKTLGKYPSPEAETILKAAVCDGDAQVRVAACEAWGNRRDDAAVKLLADLMRGDVDADVRLAAAKALGETKNQKAVEALGEALADSDPAMQYRAVLSLKRVTGKDFGNDVSRWQQYVKGEQPAPQSWASRAFGIF